MRNTSTNVIRNIVTGQVRANPSMHPRQSWRDGYEDGANGRPQGFTFAYRGDSLLYYEDGYAVGSVLSRSK
jgi:hypothetical protein